MEMWWRGPAADFVETDIAFDFLLHKIFSYHQ
jgi:hypothetical protein